jgi:hypothetical protein
MGEKNNIPWTPYLDAHLEAFIKREYWLQGQCEMPHYAILLHKQLNLLEEFRLPSSIKAESRN